MTAFTLNDAVTASLPAASNALPLRFLCGAFDGTVFTNALNGNLAALFLLYARDVRAARDQPSSDTAKPDSLSGAIYDNWIKFLLTDPNATILSLRSGTNPVDLLVAIDENRLTLKENGVYLYLGIYYFVIWYLCVNRDTNAWAEIRRYVIRTMRDEATKLNISPASFDVANSAQYKPMWRDTSEADSVFNTDRRICIRSSNSADLKPLTQIFEGIAPDRPLAPADLITFRANSLLAFKQALLDVVDAEVKRLLWMIDDDALKNFHKISWLAVGDGSGTLGFFGRDNVGIIFFEYQMAYDAAFTVKSDLGRRLDQTEGESLPSLFLAYLGKNFSGQNPKVSIVVDLPAHTAVTLAPTNAASGHFADNLGFGWNYKSGFLTFDEAPNAGLDLKFGPSEIQADNRDEVALLVLSHSLFARTFKSEISVEFKFPDNAFLIAGNQWSQFWSTGIELTDLDDLIKVLRDHLDCDLQFSGTGNGIGRRRSPPEPGAHGSAIAPDQNQRDRGVSNSTTELRNEPLRYSHGRVQRLQQFNGTKETLFFTVLGFVSPPRCTWESWSFFQEDLKPEHGTGKKIDALAIEIGSHLEQVPASGPNARPRYNTALCAFRAFSLLEAMISRFKARIVELVFDNTITSARATEMVARLDDLITKLKVPISSGQADGSGGVMLDYALFHKYAD
jgi:hypothetical protein